MTNDQRKKEILVNFQQKINHDSEPYFAPLTSVLFKDEPVTIEALVWRYEGRVNFISVEMAHMIGL